MSTLNQRLEKIIISIKVIAQLKKVERLIFKPTGVSIQRYWAVITPFVRSVSMESRADAIAGLKQLFEDIERLVVDYSKSPELINPKVTDYDRDRAERIIMSLIRLFNELPTLTNDPETGLNAAKNTYSDKAETAAELSALIDSCTRITREINLTIEHIKDRFGFDRGVNKYTYEQKKKTRIETTEEELKDLPESKRFNKKAQQLEDEYVYPSRKSKHRTESIDSIGSNKDDDVDKDDHFPLTT